MYKKEIKIKFSDCDTGGRVFFSRIFEYAHFVFEEFISEKINQNMFFNSTDFAVPITQCSAVFNKPILLHSKLSVRLVFSSLKVHSFSINYFFEKDDILFAKVETVHVFVDKSTNEKMEIPAELKVTLQSFIK